MKKNKIFIGLAVLTATLGVASCTPDNSGDPVDPGQQEQQKELSSIAVSGGTTQINEGETFSRGNVVVTATYSDGSTEDVTSKATFSDDVDSTKAGEYTVTVTYEGKTTTYKVTVLGAVVTVSSIEVDTLNVVTEYEVGQTIAYDGLLILAEYSDGSSNEIAVADATIVCKDASGAEVTGAFAASGTYTVTVTYEGQSDSYEVVVLEQQVLVSFDYNMNGVTPLAAKQDVLHASGTVLFDNLYGTKIVVGPQDGGKIKQQVYTTDSETTEKEVNGAVYKGRLQLGGSGSESKICLEINVTGACTIRILAQASGTVDPAKPRNLTLSNGQAYPTAQEEVKELSYDITEAGKYYLYSSNSGINLYNIEIEYSYAESDIKANDKLVLSGYEVEFDLTGENVFNLTAPQGLNVYTYNNKGVVTLLTEGYTVTVKNAEGTTVTSITESGTYTVVVSVNGTELVEDYEITVINPAAVITNVAVTTSEDTKVKFYEGEEFAAAGLTVVATDGEGNHKTLEAGEYEVALANPFAAAGTYTVNVTYKGVVGTYEVEYNTVKETKLVASKTLDVVAVGTTEYVAPVSLVKVYTDDTEKEVSGVTLNVEYFAEAACTTVVAEPFAQGGTVYAKVTYGELTPAVVEIQISALIKLSDYLNADNVATYSTDTQISNSIFYGVNKAKITASGNFGYTHRFQTGGKVTVKDGAVTEKALKIAVTGPCTITVYFRTGSNGSERDCAIYNAAGEILSTLGASSDTSVLTEVTYEYTGEAGFIYVGSTVNGIDIFEVTVAN